MGKRWHSGKQMQRAEAKNGVFINITAPNSINNKHYELHDLLKHTRMINIQTLQVKSLLQKTMKSEYLKNSFSSP
jgi:hypothetical protein